MHQRGNYPAGMSANVDSLCTSEARVTISQKLAWLTHSNPQRGEQTRQRGTHRGGGYELQVVYDDEGQTLPNMLIRCKIGLF